ncbi:hypothetical protein CJ030_MR1G014016 [Morella rubra]|uniref:Uncharacterized protein n=1 Tax=Morella rubra TaxID=262757 RepID=A0A6A1WMG5_9ROSI|nr:hypothetical protein CJ030_MR1G014016 [Morella rubra]
MAQYGEKHPVSQVASNKHGLQEREAQPPAGHNQQLETASISYAAVVSVALQISSQNRELIARTKFAAFN